MNRFSFLEQDYPELYLVCSDAMQYGLQDFSIAMLKSRQALEKIVEHFDAEGENLFSKINALGDDGEIPKSVMKHFHTVRKIANPSVHGQEVSEQEILEALDALFEIAVWFAVQKEGHRYEPELFNDRDRFLVRRYENQTGDEDVTNNGKSSGPSQKIDFRKILDEYRKAAEAGDAEAMRTVGEIYAMGKGVVQDYGEAIEWYQKAVNVGNTSAMIAMGKLYAEGKGVEQNFGEAMKWYEKAADAGNIDAAAMLGECYEKGNGVPQDYAEALRRYQSAAEMGSVVAMRGMSRLCAEGNGTAQDEKAALQWLQRAANKGDSWAMNNLGFAYLDGSMGLIKNLEEGQRWIEKACDAGNTEIMLSIGRMYVLQQAFDVKRPPLLKNGNEAFKLFERAANAGDTAGMCELGDYCTLYRIYEGPVSFYDKYQDIDMTDEFIRAVRTKIPHFDPALAMKWYFKAAALENADALERLGINYLLGKFVDKDVDEGLKCLRKSAEAGNVSAMMFLAHIYYNGCEVPEDKHGALYWYRQAAEKNVEAAMVAIGRMLSLGEGTEQNFEEAMKWFLKAAKAGNSDGMASVGIMYYRGVGVAQNFKEAMKWLQKAAAEGDATSFELIGDMYSNGEGVPRNKNKATAWYQKAADLGNEDAKKKLKKGFCYITTAVCDSLHKPDDCYELTMFRAFRDGWLQAQPDGNALIAEYYEVAPSIVQAIDALPNAAEIYRSIWDNYLFPCLSLLEAKNMSGCKKAYMKMVLELKEKFG